MSYYRTPSYAKYPVLITAKTSICHLLRERVAPTTRIYVSASKLHYRELFLGACVQ